VCRRRWPSSATRPSCVPATCFGAT
jgi:hypothetical protein